METNVWTVLLHFRERCTCTTKYSSRMQPRNWCTTQSLSPLLQVGTKQDSYKFNTGHVKQLCISKVGLGGPMFLESGAHITITFQ